jgi:hypothetical protein
MTSELLLHMSTAFLLGLGSSAHCMGMCGGIACALGLQQFPHPHRALLLYHTGRILAYAVIALILGSVLQRAQSYIPLLSLILRTIAALLLLAMAMQTLRLWNGILALEKIGALLWKPLHKAGNVFLPARHFWQIGALGFLWGWLPCALVYSTLSWAISQGNAIQAALLMLAFGIGTSPVLLISGAASSQVKNMLQKPAWRYGMALLLTGCALWTLYGVWQHAGHTNHTNHDTINPSSSNENRVNPQRNHSGHQHHGM